MRGKRYLRAIAIAGVLALVGAACGQGGGDQDDDGGTRGGIYRISTEDFGFTGAFDPTGEYLGTAWAYYTNLLLRTLVTYKHVAGPEGNEIVPDLAEDLPEVSDDGLTYTFTLKDGIQFGPPVSREITSADIEYAFRRIATAPLAAQYGFYYFGVIEGMDAAEDSTPADISGIETPDDKTIVFNLTAPTGDILNRLAMPATAPVPEEVGGCFEDEAGAYGRFVIASGPYMIEGSDALDISSCDTMENISGFDPTERLSFVRNPNYDEATDSTDVRESLIDGLLVTINTNTEDIFDRIEAGQLEGEVSSPPPDVLQRYSTTPELEDRLQAESGDRTWYITMNLTQPPFDDINVRKAVNFVMDKAGLLRAWGGPIRGDIATHITPPEMTGGTPTAEEYDPYPSTDFGGDVDAAKAAMAESQYDSDGDGVCDSPVCNNVRHITRNVSPWTEMTPIIEAGLAEIGIELNTRELETGTAYTTIQNPSNGVPIASNAGWGKDYADASTFAVLFDSAGIAETGSVNYALVGITPELAVDVKAAEGILDAVPNVDEQIVACNALVDQERLDCWIDFDKFLMEEVVPWVPYLWATNVDIIGPAVSQYEFDQFSGEAAFSHVAVDPSKQVEG